MRKQKSKSEKSKIKYGCLGLIDAYFIAISSISFKLRSRTINRFSKLLWYRTNFLLFLSHYLKLFHFSGKLINTFPQDILLEFFFCFSKKIFCFLCPANSRKRAFDLIPCGLFATMAGYDYFAKSIFLMCSL